MSNSDKSGRQTAQNTIGQKIGITDFCPLKGVRMCEDLYRKWEGRGGNTTTPDEFRYTRESVSRIFSRKHYKSCRILTSLGAKPPKTPSAKKSVSPTSAPLRGSECVRICIGNGRGREETLQNLMNSDTTENRYSESFPENTYKICGILTSRGAKTTKS